MITQEELIRLFHYDPRTGIFIEKTKRKNKNVGDIMGTLSKQGYLVGVINKKQYKLHRLAYLYMTGVMPDKVDHENHIISDNRWCNLRNASSFDNMQNTKMSVRNTSGCVGVYWNKTNLKWEGRIDVNKKRIFLGSFELYHEAVNARKNAEVLYGFHENHGKTEKELLNVFELMDTVSKEQGCQ